MKTLTIISTDWHIKPSNTEQIIGLIQQKIELAKRSNVDKLICLGDIFQSRQAQPLSVLKCFEHILDMINKADMDLYCIAGNHDKTDYSSPDSFLDQFKWHPAFYFISTERVTLSIGGWEFYFLPYYEESKWVSELAAILGDWIGLAHGKKLTGKEILLSHQALYGSVNNDGSKIENSIKPSVFKDFYKVFLGHYHNQQQIDKNIFHLPSLQANNFGEDNDKGFTVFYDDGSHELVNSEFPEYHTIKIDLDRVSKQELNDIKKDGATLIKDSGANIRFKFEGSEDKVKAIKQEEFTVFGIDVKKEHKTIIKSIEKAETGEIVIYTERTILEKFDKFCEEEEYDNVEYGRKCLTQKLKSNGKK